MNPTWTDQSRSSSPNSSKTRSLRISRETAIVLGGQILFGSDESLAAHRILAGEVLIVRNGHIVDLVQAGELLDPRIWDDAIAVALTDCVLEEIPTASGKPSIPAPDFFRYTPPTALDQELYLAATAMN